MRSNSIAVADALYKCFGRDGDVVVVARPGGAQHTADQGKSCEADAAECKRAQKKARLNDHFAEFRVWSALLSAWSDVFAAMFTHDLAEKKECRIEIVDFSVGAVETFLRFMYSGNLQAGPPIVIEVSALADKYCIGQLQDLCRQAIDAELVPKNACEMLQAADQVGAAVVRERCLETILRSPREALPGAFLLSPALLQEALTSPLLCISDLDLSMILLGWANSPAAKIREINIPALLEAHVQLAALSDAEYSNVRCLAEAAGFAEKLGDMRAKAKRGQNVTDVTASLWTLYSKEFPDSKIRPPFLGYWINVIPSKASFGQRDTSTSGHLSVLEQMASSRGSNNISLKANEDMTWMMPHHRVIVTSVAFQSKLGDTNQIEFLVSDDGAKWDMLLDTGVITSANLRVERVPCRSRHPVNWLKLRVRKGQFNDRIQVGGILQTL